MQAEKLLRISTEQEKVIIDAQNKVVINKRIGDVIYKYNYELQELLSKFLEGRRRGKEWEEIVVEMSTKDVDDSGYRSRQFFYSVDEKRLVLNVCVDDLRFTLNLKKDIMANAARYYELSKRSKRRLKGAENALKETRKKLSEVEEKIDGQKVLTKIEESEVENEVLKKKIKRKKWFEKFRWFVSSDGYLIVAGKDAVSNEVLIKKYVEDDDVIFHADIVGAPFVVIKSDGKKITEQCLIEASEFAAAFSRGWREGFSSLDVYWVTPTQLSKAGYSGEYVTRGAFSVRGKRNWMRGVQLRLGVGILEENGLVNLVGGPVNAVKAKTNRYLIIIPGASKGKTLFKEVLKRLALQTSKDHREKILGLPIEEIRKLIPYSKGRVADERQLAF
jgi:predicted ribosome quality control (RQC) complex YloA/Tae2 family protein